MSYNLLCLWYWIGFIAVPFYLTLPELAKRRIQVLFAQQRSCLAPNMTQLANGLRICPARAKWNWNHCSHKLVNAGKCLLNASEKIPSPTRHRSVRTSTAPTVTWTVIPCLFLLYVVETLYTLRCDYLSLFQEGEWSGGGQHVLSNLHFRVMEGKDRSNPFCHHATRGGRKHTGKKRKLEISKGVVNIL